MGVGVILAALTASGTAEAAPPTAKAPVITNWYRLPAAHRAARNTWFSSNWSGYAESGHFTAVSGRWTVPSVTAGVADAQSDWFSSAWIGIDGFNNTHLIQTGTEQDFYDGTPHYSAWWEILPKAESPLPATDAVLPGDEMGAAIVQTQTTSVTRKRTKTSKTSRRDWTIVLSDMTQGWTFVTTEAYKGPGDSAEFIVESPLVGHSIATIANYTFPRSSAAGGDFSSAGIASTIGDPLTTAGLEYGNDSGVLVQNGVQISTPGFTNLTETAFNAAYGASTPPAPTS